MVFGGFGGREDDLGLFIYIHCDDIIFFTTYNKCKDQFKLL